MKITCPYCFKKFHSSRAVFRCRNEARCSGAGPDHIYSEARDISPPEVKGRVFTPPDNLINRVVSRLRVRRSTACDACNNESFERLCPHCHQKLSHDAGRVRERTIAVIGARASGKSNFIAVLVHELRFRVLSNFSNASMQTIGDETANRYQDDFESFVYGDTPRPVPPTQSATARDASSRTPLIYRLNFGTGWRAKAVNLVLFDTAGEDMNSLDVMSSETRYITSADGLIFLLDPTQNKQVRQQVEEASNIPAIKDSDPIVIIDRLYTLYEQMQAVKINEKIKKPIAFTLSKIDVIQDILPPSSNLLRNSDHFNQLTTADIESVHAELQILMERWGIHGTVDPRFSRYRYFGISAFGGSPSSSGTLNYVSPKRVEDPILWILSELNIVKKG